MTGNCPLCGHNLGLSTTVWNVDQRTLLTATGFAVNFTYREASLFDALWRRHPAHVEGNSLLREVWGNYVYERHVDGPRTPDLVRTNIYRVNKKLRGSGINIELKGPSYGWRITINSSQQTT
jgi:DNA-binding winged helix-turn-helix (wHTH) protein